jgi:hemolysin activation/secretion protein
VFCGAASASAFCQELPVIAAQELQRQQQREREQNEQVEKQQPDVRLPRAARGGAQAYPANESPCFPIHSIELGGDSAVRFAWALEAVDDARGRCLGTGGVNVVIARVQDVLIGAGFVTTRVVAAPQDLRGGTLALVLVPGRIHAIRFAEPVAPGADYRTAVPASAGDILNLRDVEQALENFKRVPTADVDMQIVPGQRPGESDLLIAWKQAFPIRFTWGADDGGSDATGRYQGSATLSVDNPLGWNDLFYASVSKNLPIRRPRGEHGTRGYALHYSVPFGYWLASVSGSDNRYRQSIAGLTQDYVYSGTSRNLELKLTRMVYRDASRKTSMSLRAYQRRSRNFIDDTEVEVQRRSMSGAELGLVHKEYLGGATLEASIAYRQGLRAFGAMAAPEEAFGEGTARPRIINADINLSVPMTLPQALGGARLSYQGAWRAQWNRSDLIAQDRFAIGGRYTVRGFDGESSLAAERGWLLRNELGWTPAGTAQQFYLAFDYGQVSGPGAAYLSGTHLAGAGIGWRGQYGQFLYDLFTGRPVSKPDRFRTAATSSGFNLSYQF